MSFLALGLDCKIAIGCEIFIWWLFVPFALMTIIWIANDSAAFLYYTSDQGNALHEAAQPLTRTACVIRPNWLGASVDTPNVYTNFVATPDFYTDNDHMPILNSVAIVILIHPTAPL